MPAKAQNPGFKTCLHNCHPEKTPAASRKAAIIRNLPIFNTTSRGQHNHNLTHTCGEGASRCVAQTAENRITTDREYVKFSGRLVKGLQQGSQLSALTIARYKEAWGKLYPGTEPPMTTDGFPADFALDDNYTTEDIPWLERFLEQGGKLKVTARPSRATPMVDEGRSRSRSTPMVDEGRSHSRSTPMVDEGRSRSRSTPMVDEGQSRSRSTPMVDERRSRSRSMPMVDERRSRSRSMPMVDLGPSRDKHTVTGGPPSHILNNISTSCVSQSSSLLIATSIFATIFIAFGINAILRPRHALKFFEFEAPASASDAKLVNGLMVIYGARDVFVGLAIYSAAYFGERKSLGWILIAGSGVAFVDGAVCRAHVGKGEWNHWSYAPILTAVGSVLLGVLDGV